MSDCPYCGFPNCYNSGFTVECANPDCQFASPKQLTEFISDRVSNLLRPFTAPAVKPEPIYDCQILQAALDALPEPSLLKNFVTDEVRRRALLLLSGESVGQWPDPLVAFNPAPTVLGITWPQPDVELKYRIIWLFEF